MLTERLSPEDADILEALASGKAFGAACGADDEEERGAVDGANVLVTAAQLGLVTRVLPTGR